MHSVRISVNATMYLLEHLLTKAKPWVQTPVLEQKKMHRFLGVNRLNFGEYILFFSFQHWAVFLIKHPNKIFRILHYQKMDIWRKQHTPFSKEKMLSARHPFTKRGPQHRSKGPPIKSYTWASTMVPRPCFINTGVLCMCSAQSVFLPSLTPAGGKGHQISREAGRPCFRRLDHSRWEHVPLCMLPGKMDRHFVQQITQGLSSPTETTVWGKCIRRPGFQKEKKMLFLSANKQSNLDPRKQLTLLKEGSCK
jgi:hypothetical protein